MNRINSNNLSDEQGVLAEELGGDVFEIATLRYLSEVDETTAQFFEQFVIDNSHKETFWTDLYQAYPDFGAIIDYELNELAQEMETLKKVDQV